MGLAAALKRLDLVDKVQLKKRFYVSILSV